MGHLKGSESKMTACRWREKGRQGERTVPWPGLALAPPSRRGGGGPSMHTLAVLRRTNCFSLRQISCKSRLRRQHCPSPPGRRDGRQADGARGRGGGGGRGGGWRVERVYQRRLGAGWRRKERRRRRRRRRRGRSHENGEKRREREKSSNTSRVPLSLSLCSSIVQAECPPNLLHPYPQKPHRCSAPPRLHPSIPPSPLFHQLSDLCSAPLLAPPFSIALPPSPSLYRKVEERWNSTKREKNQ